MKQLQFSGKTLSAQWQLVNEWLSQLHPDLDGSAQQLQAIVQSTPELSLKLLRQRHLELCRPATARPTVSTDAAWTPCRNCGTSIPQLRVPPNPTRQPAATVVCTLPAPLEKG